MKNAWREKREKEIQIPSTTANCVLPSKEDMTFGSDDDEIRVSEGDTMQFSTT
jgi:hypothetical protein